MHIVIGLLTTVAGLFWAINALKQSGAWDSMNPFLWRRKRHWQSKYHTNPLYNLTKPLDVAGVLILGVARLEGELSSEHKLAVLALYKKELHLDEKQASEMFVSSSYYLKDTFPLSDKIGKILEHSIEKFEKSQKQSVLQLIKQIAAFEAEPNQEQQKVIQAVSSHFQIQHS
jgi:hypothetical protein